MPSDVSRPSEEADRCGAAGGGLVGVGAGSSSRRWCT